MPQVLVITGMGRSGTSLAASLLQRTGLDLGDRLLESGSPNPRGYFEDADFVDFQERLLKTRGRTILVDEGFSFVETEEESSEAQQLLASRADRPLWGWKDPRTALFLDFWDARVEGAVYLFLFRHPLDVLLSLLRYGEPGVIGLAEGVRAWETYNTRILEFCARRPERCALVHAEGLPKLNALNETLRDKLGLEAAVTPDMLAEIYDPAEFHSSSDWAKGAFGLIEHRAAGLYETLLREADVAPPAVPTSDEPRDLAAFRAFAGELLPRLGPNRRGLLLTLVEIICPDIAERAFERQQEWIRQQEEARAWLDEQRLGWQQRAEDFEQRPVRTLLRRLAHRFRNRD